MIGHEENQDEVTFKVTDRRKFNPDGSVREGVVIDEPRLEPSVAEPTERVPSQPVTHRTAADAVVPGDDDLEDEDDLERLIHEAGRFCLTHVSLRLNVESLTLNGMETLPVSTFVTSSHESRV